MRCTPRDDLFYDIDLEHIQFGDMVGLEATTALTSELEVITGKAGWYEKRALVYDVIESTRRRSPHAAMLLAVPKDLPVADLAPWTSRFVDPEFADEAIRLMVHGYVLRGLEPGSKFDYAGILVGPPGHGQDHVVGAPGPWPGDRVRRRRPPTDGDLRDVRADRAGGSQLGAVQA
ncbi:hypothetical protein ACFOJ6_13845 [Gordonia humi]|uniref:hypothetical protein n=1 Tax=Gordonia humi TaxID=686429 RepID=UPI00360EE820